MKKSVFVFFIILIKCYGAFGYHENIMNSGGSFGKIRFEAIAGLENQYVNEQMAYYCYQYSSKYIKVRDIPYIKIKESRAYFDSYYDSFSVTLESRSIYKNGAYHAFPEFTITWSQCPNRVQKLLELLDYVIDNKRKIKKMVQIDNALGYSLGKGLIDKIINEKPSEKILSVSHTRVYRQYYNNHSADSLYYFQNDTFYFPSIKLASIYQIISFYDKTTLIFDSDSTFYSYSGNKNLSKHFAIKKAPGYYEAINYDDHNSYIKFFGYEPHFDPKDFANDEITRIFVFDYKKNKLIDHYEQIENKVIEDNLNR